MVLLTITTHSGSIHSNFVRIKAKAHFRIGLIIRSSQVVLNCNCVWPKNRIFEFWRRVPRMSSYRVQSVKLQVSNIKHDGAVV